MECPVCGEDLLDLTCLTDEKKIYYCTVCKKNWEGNPSVISESKGKEKTQLQKRVGFWNRFRNRRSITDTNRSS